MRRVPLGLSICDFLGMRWVQELIRENTTVDDAEDPMRWNDRDETMEFPDVFCKAETAKACLCVIDGAEHWIPKSQIHDDSEVYEEGHEGRLVVTQWIAEAKGLV